MNKILFAIFFSLCSLLIYSFMEHYLKMAEASHLATMSGDNINSGSVDPEFIDTSNSSITKRGQLTDGTQDIRIGSGTFTRVVTSSSGFTGGQSTFTGVQVNGNIAGSSITSLGIIHSTSGFTGGRSTFTIVVFDSITVRDVIHSTSGYTGGRSTFTTVVVSSLTSTDVISAIAFQGGRSTFTIVQIDSITARDLITSTSGFQGGRSSFTHVVVDSMTVTYGSMTIRGINYRWPTADGSNGQVLHTDGSGGLTWNTDDTGGGGGGTTTPSTMTATRSSGGDVFIASANFISIPNLFYTTGFSTWQVIAVQAFTLNTSTAGSTFFRLARTTATDNGQPFNYISPVVEVATATKYSTWISTSFQLQFNETYSVHITSHYEAGTRAANFGFKLRYWKISETQ